MKANYYNMKNRVGPILQHRWMKATLYIPIYLVGITAYAQVPPPKPLVIEIDSITRFANATIPFDEPFVLKVRSDEMPAFAFSIATKGTKDAVTILTEADKKAKRTNKVGPAVADIIAPSRLTMTKDGGRSYILITFIDVEYRIGPSTNLYVLFSNSEKKGLEVVELLHAGDQAGAIKLADEIHKDQFDKLGFNFLSPPGTPPAATGLKPGDEIKAVYAKIKNKLEAVRTGGDAFDKLVTTAKASAPGDCDDRLLRAALLDTLRKTWGCILDCDLEKDLLALSAMSTSELEKLYRGERTVRSAKEITAPASQLDALKATRAVLQRMFTYQQASSSVTRKGMPDCWKNMIAQVDLLLPALKELSEARNALNNELNFYYGQPTDIGAASSEIFSYDTRNSFQATPDFGLIAVGGPTAGITRLAPYFGAQFNFRYTKKNLKWRGYPFKKPLSAHHWSVSIGYCATKLAEAAEREDFFPKASLLTGVGYRISHTLRITSGTVWFYALDPNPAVKERKLNIMPFLGFSVDIDLAKYLGDFTSILKP